MISWIKLVWKHTTPFWTHTQILTNLVLSPGGFIWPHLHLWVLSMEAPRPSASRAGARGEVRGAPGAAGGDGLRRVVLRRAGGQRRLRGRQAPKRRVSRRASRLAALCARGASDAPPLN